MITTLATTLPSSALVTPAMAEAVTLDAFWPVTVSNADGPLEANGLGVDSSSDFPSEPSDDGSCRFPSPRPVD